MSDVHPNVKQYIQQQSRQESVGAEENFEIFRIGKTNKQNIKTRTHADTYTQLLP